MQNKKTLSERLDYYTMTEPNTGCWLWLGQVDNGYGRLSVSNRHCGAHRLSWERHNGPIPKGMQVCHKCDVKICINPDHLFLGTQKDNIQDALKKGRMPRGENHYFARLTESQAIEIINDPRCARLIGLAYGISTRHANEIKTGESWGYLQGHISNVRVRNPKRNPRVA